MARLTKITTGAGDRGTTTLADGSRVAKDDPRIEAIGAVDELNSAIGLLLAETVAAPVRAGLTAIQHDLFDLGGDLATPAPPRLAEAAVARLERWQAELLQELPPLAEFLLPGGSRAAALAHMARTICRRAERRTVTLARARPAAGATLPYLNRLSDLLFCLARHLNRSAAIAEPMWARNRQG
ncbi:MAG: ATP:cob(I)alamin adenosyltransferase [Nitrospirae bacterium CG18_big_fil_WC_8_21_14_2_50_70_55]|nr:cob(I)yrinic acid a,c-diamide adenosyltransferase [Deltaproteobacteria bacterium]OIP67689.1 MAG: ATP:cob(I)alamin adenosyltransferase [Nitrospirae bacterium CG2_30_70_394]PIQ06618.1 MAG: ATP:cob(I)alamin adenosyltransferase [Nitrospirae bacterium CG18_big_fil_WC_8_21_14_2_50_70_55]PIU78562.1 MAG: ATP:cob(I)alamin adenosyltransferase [Nitrospirae bacterium CG06_land_8_20_14_3_00_70_43]PIW82875.1 MAG: ATP:cob(I)alamin adenosyltransferase [Nitrospirae bacterium CG_4_8_14_3_um_filter_70_85]PIX8